MRRIGIGLALLLAGCGPNNDPNQSRAFAPDGPYKHEASGFVFPIALPPFRLTTITEYGAKATAVGATYVKRAGADGVFTFVNVYPAPAWQTGTPQQVEENQDHLCKGAWDSLLSGTVRSHPNSKTIEQGQIASPSATFTKFGHRAVFVYTGTFAGMQQPMHSEIDLFCNVNGRWMIGYFTTAPATSLYRPDLAMLMRNLQWPEAMPR